MDLPIQPDQASLRTRVTAVLERIETAYELADGQDEASPATLGEAFNRLLDIVGAVEDQAVAQNASEPPINMTELGEYSISLLDELARWVTSYNLDEQRATVAELQTGFALWIARHGGELLTLEPVVDALALFANRILEEDKLHALFGVMGEILKAVAPVLQQDLEKANPGRPWRLLNLNRAIVATRSHDQAAMQEAFDQLVERLPEDAAGFFAQGMQQMEALDYPAPVREVVKSYYDEWNRKHRLH